MIRMLLLVVVGVIAGERNDRVGGGEDVGSDIPTHVADEDIFV